MRNTRIIIGAFVLLAISTFMFFAFHQNGVVPSEKSGSSDSLTQAEIRIIATKHANSQLPKMELEDGEGNAMPWSENEVISDSSWSNPVHEDGRYKVEINPPAGWWIIVSMNEDGSDPRIDQAIFCLE